jgi:2-succinyl-5-enolpyruvyl-6-hydroxy-3-cyclohexene-1-carboxylate synthase
MTNLSHAEVLGCYVAAFVDELVAAGVEHVCLCPGSRSTPLALAFARESRIRTWMHLDERSCAYFALGMAKASGKPVALLCSSGTAAVNFAPAVVEAYHSGVPLIVLTADRPQELRDLGANQTIDQVRLYGSAAKWAVEMPLPEASPEMLRYVRMVAKRAAATAVEGVMGPVHLNFPFREPLTPSFPAVEPGWGRFPAVPEDTAPISDLPRSLIGQVGGGRRVLVICGPGHLDTEGIVELAGGRWPVLADPLSGLRAGPHAGPVVIGAYNSFLRSPALAERLKPNFIIRFGAPPTSKALETCLASWHDVPQIVVAPPGRWPDPYLTATWVVHCSPAALSKAIGRPRVGPDWLAAWQDAESRTLAAIQGYLDMTTAASEPSVIADLAEILEDGTLFAGNSMPVRDLDSFFPVSHAPVRLVGNRGASGIDGVVSTALGMAAVSDRRVVLVIGDLSFYHDMNGLLAAKRFGLNATIVLVNNDGGGIFSFLPQHDAAPAEFEALWGTPHGLDFAPVAGLYGVGFQRVTTREEYRAAVRASLAAPGVQVIEVRTDREENLALHKEIWRAVEAAVAPVAAK